MIVGTCTMNERVSDVCYFGNQRGRVKINRRMAQSNVFQRGVGSDDPTKGNHFDGSLRGCCVFWFWLTVCWTWGDGKDPLPHPTTFAERREHSSLLVTRVI